MRNKRQLKRRTVVHAIQYRQGRINCREWLDKVLGRKSVETTTNVNVRYVRRVR